MSVSRSAIARRSVNTAAGLLGDRLLGEPPSAVHPVAIFGQLMKGVEARLYSPQRVAGVAYALLGVGVGVTAGSLMQTPAIALTLAAGGRRLREAALEVHGALVDSDLEGARALLPALVGRDPSQLDERGVAAAVIESVAENTVDAVVAPAFWALAAGSPGAIGYRAINTMDAMVGHRSARYEQFGRLSARLDDAANLVPARLTAALVASVRPRAAGEVWRALRQDAPSHPSPNAGVAEAAFAAALGVGLGGALRYGGRVERRPTLGRGPRPVALDIKAGRPSLQRRRACPARRPPRGGGRGKTLAGAAAMSDAVPSGPHGGDGAALAAILGVPPKAVLDLSASLNPMAPDVTRLAKRHLDGLLRYPDETAATAALAEALGVDVKRVVLTNGGAEAIALVAALLPVGWVEEPDFSLYARHLRELRADAPGWRSNPHNPSGRLAAAEEQAAVWDEAFYQLATGRWTRGEGDIAIGSLTKLFACPGLRLGYVVAADPEVATQLQRLKPRWSVNALACALAPELVALADLPRWAPSVASLRAELVEVLASRGLRADPSDANFLFVREAAGLRDRLARRGVLVRDTTSFGIPHGVRIAVPDSSGLEKLANALGGCSDESL